MSRRPHAVSRRRFGIAVLQVLVTTAIWVPLLSAGPVSLDAAVPWSLVAAMTVTLSLVRRTSAHQMIRSYTEDVSDVVLASLLGAVAALAAAAATNRLLPAGFVLAASAATIVALLLIRSLAARSRAMQRGGRRLIVIGTGEEGAELTQLVVEHPEAALELVGVVGNAALAERNGLSALLLGDVAELASVLDTHAIDAAMVTPTSFRSPQYRRIMAATEAAGVDVFLSSGVGRIAAPRFDVSSLVHEPFLAIGWDAPSHAQQVVRRIIDIVGAIVGLILASPIMVVAAAAVKIGDRGPVLYRSGRIGRQGEPFGMLKFRSMHPDADDLKNDLAQRNERSGPLFKLSNDPRVTPVGRILRETSIDELPQLINVLRGEMSLVGPRPALPEEFERFDDELLARFDVRPGITGLWQVEARSNAEFGAYRRLDLHYVSNWTLGLDIAIILATVVQITTSLLLLPVSLVTRRGINDQISAQSIAPVIDLRHSGDGAPSLEAPTSEQPPSASTGN